MKTKQFLLSILLIGLILAAGCVGKNNTTVAPEKNAETQTTPTGESVAVDTSSIDAGITDADAEQAELAGDIDESALDLGI